MDDFRIEYNLHKDGSWVSDGFDTREEAEEAFNRLKADGYNPRRKYK